MHHIAIYGVERLIRRVPKVGDAVEVLMRAQSLHVAATQVLILRHCHRHTKAQSVCSLGGLPGKAYNQTLRTQKLCRKL